MTITLKKDESKQMTIFTGSGEITFEEVRNAIVSFYEREGYTQKVLWDLRDAVATGITSKQVDQIADLLKEYGGPLKGIRTAIVSSVDITFGLSRMLMALLESKEKGRKSRMQVFRTMEEAIEWLDEQQ